MVKENPETSKRVLEVVEKALKEVYRVMKTLEEVQKA